MHIWSKILVSSAEATSFPLNMITRDYLRGGNVSRLKRNNKLTQISDKNAIN